MKIVYTIMGTYNSGGMERVLANKANYLAALGHDLTIITTDQKKRISNFPLHESIQQIDLDVNYADIQSLGLLAKIFAFKKKQRIHRRACRAELFNLKVDIVISMFDHDANFLYKIQDGSKKVLEIHFSRFKKMQYNIKGLWKLINYWRNRQDLLLARKYDRFVVLTHEDLGYWKGLNNISVIPNAHTFSPPYPAKLLRKHAIAVGRLDYQKGFDNLIIAWKRIVDKFPDWKLDIYGHGPLAESFNYQIEALALKDHISINAPVKDIMSELLQSSMILMTSRYEGLPMVLLEAQACGIPMVAFACKCGPKDIIKQGENGFLVAQGDISDFADKVCFLMENQDRRRLMGGIAREHSENFNEHQIMAKWLALFSSLLNEKNII